MMQNRNGISMMFNGIILPCIRISFRFVFLLGRFPDFLRPGQLQITWLSFLVVQIRTTPNRSPNRNLIGPKIIFPLALGATYLETKEISWREWGKVNDLLFDQTGSRSWETIKLSYFVGTDLRDSWRQFNEYEDLTFMSSEIPAVMTCVGIRDDLCEMSDIRSNRVNWKDLNSGRNSQ
jgi:hypothetical protein